MSPFKLLLRTMCITLVASQNTICVWNGEGIRDGQNGEYILSGTSTSSNGDSHNYWEKSSPNCPQYLHAVWFAEDTIHYWVLYDTFTTYGDHIMSECGDDWQTFPENPTLCANGWDDWRTGSSVAIAITVTAGTCPSLSCPAIHLTNSGIYSCDQVFLRDLTKHNVFAYSSGTITTYLYFNANTFKWYCSDALDTDNCNDDESITHQYLSSKNDEWNDVSIGGQFTLTMSNGNDAVFECIATSNPTNTVTSVTPSPSRNPTKTPTVSPTSMPVESTSTAPTLPPTTKNTAVPTKSAIKPSIAQPTTQNTIAIVTTLAHEQDPATTDAPQSTQDRATTYAPQNTEESRKEHAVKRYFVSLHTWIIIVAGCAVCSFILCAAYSFRKHNVKHREEPQMIEGNMNDSAPGTIPHAMQNTSDMDINEVYHWFEFKVGYGHYAAMFIRYGCDSLNAIMSIHDRRTLKAIGVNKVGHQSLIFDEIKKLRERHGIPEEESDDAAPETIELRVEMVPGVSSSPLQPGTMQLTDPQMVDDLIRKQKIRILQLQSQQEPVGEGLDETTDTFQSDVFFAKQEAKSVLQVTKGGDVDFVDC